MIGTPYVLHVFKIRQSIFLNELTTYLLLKGLNSYLYIKDAKSYFDEPREKLSPRPLCGRGKQSRDRQRIS
jgi:hypothetical protein